MKDKKFKTKREKEEANDRFFNRLFIILSILIFLFSCYAMISGIFKTLDAMGS